MSVNLSVIIQKSVTEDVCWTSGCFLKTIVYSFKSVRSLLEVCEKLVRSLPEIRRVTEDVCWTRGCFLKTIVYSFKSVRSLLEVRQSVRSQKLAGSKSEVEWCLVNCQKRCCLIEVIVGVTYTGLSSGFGSYQSTVLKRSVSLIN